MFCSKCGASNLVESRFCSSCGFKLDFTDSENKQESEDVVTAEEYYKEFLGPKNQAYYLNEFLHFDALGKIKATWHWPAFFITFYWLLYRKMWLNAFLYFLSPYLIFIPLGMLSVVMGEGGTNFIGMMYVLFLILLFIVPPMYANALYYKHAEKKIVGSLPEKNVQKRLRDVSMKGGTSNIVLIIACIFGFFAVIGILAAIAIPAYSDYVNRAKTAAAYLDGQAITIQVSNFYYQNKSLPKLEEIAAFHKPAKGYDLGINKQNGVISITFDSGQLTNKSLTFTPSLDSNNQVIWKCTSNDIEFRKLPSECRN